MAWFSPAAAAAAPLVLPYYHRCVPGRCFYGPDGQHHFCSMGVGVAQPIIYGNSLPNVEADSTPGSSVNNVFVSQPSYQNIAPATAAAVCWPVGAWPATNCLDAPLLGRRPEDYHPYTPRLQAHRDGSVPGLEYIPVLRDGWADYSSRTNHAVAPPVCDRC
ncbi:uncharacterized protein PG986_012342 [Apiospora aurea]|uniref:Uncharacterized protein n=1 Tax=Apiospora aurea TaxID=335848 RepID=A0ABR1PZQ6_9PEZI